MVRRCSVLYGLMLGYILVLPLNAAAQGLARGTMEGACTSKLRSLNDLCALFERQFPVAQEEFVQIDKDVYLVAVTDTSRIAQGIYAVNITAEKMDVFGGYGAPTFGKSFTDANGITYLKVSYWVPMHQGRSGSGESILHIRTNPITGKKYVIEQPVEDTIRFDGEKPDETIVYGNVPVPGKRRILDKTFVAKIVASHKAALKCHEDERTGKRTKGAPFSIMEKAGIWAIVDQRPPDMTQQQYVNIMNDYAFFAYKYGEGRTDLAIEILWKVIDLAPERTPAYLNIADALDYAAEYQEIPLAEEVIDKLSSAAKQYRGIYESMKLKK